MIKKKKERKMSEEIKNTIEPELNEPEASDEPVEIVGINFREAGKIYFFSPNGLKLSVGSRVIVETARGVELGTVKVANKTWQRTAVWASPGQRASVF